jgi:serine phosphatase RsbU (regulator of sigma subunit)
MSTEFESHFASPFGASDVAELEVPALRERLASLQKLVEITRRLAAETDLERLLQIVTNGACEAVGCERASLFLYDTRRNELYTRVVTELEISEIRTTLDRGITGWVGRHRRLLNVPDPATDDRWNSTVDQRTGFQTRNVVATPLISQHDGKLLGVLELLNRHGGPFTRPDEELLQAFASHAAVALERAQLLLDVARTRELEFSLDAARNVQTGFLPDQLPVIPGYELAAWWEPAQGVGGDYYDVVRLPDGRLAIAVADVSGHGLAPSLIMASTRAMLHVLARTCSDPARILTLLAETIHPDLRQGRFITFLLGALDLARHELTFVNAGHGPVIYYRRQTGETRLLEPTGLPLGILPGQYHESQQPLAVHPGDLMVFATDGVVEVRNSSGAMFGRKRLELLLQQHERLSATEMIALLRQELMTFYDRPHPDDDITLLVLERKLTP